MIQNIIFDLGNVLLDINVQNAHDNFKALLGDEYESAYLKLWEGGHFTEFEVGKFNEAVFIDVIQKATSKTIKYQDIIDAWNGVLLEIKPARIEMLKRLGQTHDIYLLSNTNATHIEWVNQYLQRNFQFDIKAFNQLFKYPFYSHLVHMRKPDAEIYEYVLSYASLKAEETLFIDDHEPNIIGARKLGIVGYHHTVGEEIADLIDELL
ncbi:MAG: HAD family phosphatase [Bacteroidota bacterium]